MVQCVHWTACRQTTPIIWTGCPSCHPNNSVEAQKETQTTDHNQWPGPVLFSSTTGLLTEEALFSLCWLPDTACPMKSVEKFNIYPKKM